MSVKRSPLGGLFVLILPVFFSDAHAGYSSLYVFGDSLSDSGNNAVLLAPNVTPVPISGNSFIAHLPYASGRYTNDDIWAQTLASSLGLSASPSLLGGTDHAFGGARTGPLTDLLPPSLEAQAAAFLFQHGSVAPSDALYVIEGGGQNARDALTLIGGCGSNLVCIDAIIQSTVAAFAADIGNIDSELEGAGAKNIVVWNVPDIGTAPAVRALDPSTSALGTTIAAAMNAALSSAIGGDPEVTLFDAFGLLEDVVADPGAFGLSNVTDACAQFITCDPSKYLFWDGIHPTSAAEPIISDAILSLVVAEPSTVALLGVALAGLGFVRRRRPNA